MMKSAPVSALPAQGDANKFFSEYGGWVDAIWFGDSEPSDRDYAIMGLGLAGETAEVGIAFELADPQNRVKELGDCAYYAVRIGNAFKLPQSAAYLAKQLDVRQASPEAVPAASLKFMAQSAGGVCELIKKAIRDGIPSEHAEQEVFLDKLNTALKNYWAGWVSAALVTGKSPREVLLANHEKVQSRLVRGVLRGSGDNR